MSHTLEEPPAHGIRRFLWGSTVVLSGVVLVLSFVAFYFIGDPPEKPAAPPAPEAAQNTASASKPGNGRRHLFGPSLYRSVQLLLLHAEPEAEGRETWIYTAQVLAVIVVSSTVLLTLWKIFERNVRLASIRWFGRHVVVCGLGPTGLQLVKEFRREGQSIIALEKGSDNENVPDAEERGALIFREDPASRRNLRAAMLDRAKYLIAVCEDDGTNVEIARKAMRVILESKHASANSVRCFVHIVELELRTLFARNRLLSAHHERGRIKILNIFENSARLLFSRHSLEPFCFSPADPRQVHLILFGFGQMGRSVALQAAKIGHFANGRKLRITVIDKAATVKRNAFEYHYPFFGEICDLTFLEWDTEDLSNLHKVGELTSAEGVISTCVVCFDSDTRSLSFALKLLKHVPKTVPIRVRMQSRGGFASLLDNREAAQNEAAQMTVFGSVGDACTIEMIVGEKLDALARVAHEDYVKKRKMEGQRDASDPSLAPWESLDEDLLDSNRQQADHIDVKLRAIGCYRGAECDGKEVELSEAEIETLSRMEHARWNAERQLAGWSFAPGPKDMEKRTSPYIVPWEALTEQVKGWDREAVRNIPRLLRTGHEYVFR